MQQTQTLRAIALAMGAAFLMAAPAVNAQYADYIFKNGEVYTQDERRPWAEAVAVKDNKIVYVGSTRAAQTYAGTSTQIVDLNGRMLMPGFVEAHIHPSTAWAVQGADLQTDDVGELLQRVKTWADENPHAPLVQGFGWRYSALPTTGPTRQMLDDLIPDRPVFLFAIDMHAAWVNSRALEMAGITRESPDPQPPFSTYARDPATGELTGYLVEIPALMPTYETLNPLGAEAVRKGLKSMLPKFAAAGITSVFDAGIFGTPVESGYEIYQSLERAGELPVRVVGSYYYNDPAEDPIPRTVALRDTVQSNLVQASTLKINVDGGETQRTAAMLEPYEGSDNFRGEPLIPQTVLNRVVQQAQRNGLNTLCHCFGDAATRSYLDAVALAKQAYPRSPSRHTTSHAMYVNEADISRMAELDVTMQVSAQWATPDAHNLTVAIDAVGKARISRDFMRMASVLSGGARLAFGTDWNAAGYYSTFRPLEAIQVALTREMLHGKGVTKVMPPANERITLAQALRASTLDAAYVLGLETQTGSLEIGKKADLVVLEKNLFDVAPDQIAQTPVRMTMMDGRITYLSDR